MKKISIYLCLISFIFTHDYCDAKPKKKNDTQSGLEEMSRTADSMEQELTKAGTSIGSLVKNIKSIFDSTAREIDDENNESVQSCQQNLSNCQQNLKEVNNKFNIIYEYANNKLKDILNNKNHKTVDSMYNEIAQLQSIWNSITNLPTADQVSQFLKTHNQFYDSMNKYVNNQSNGTPIKNNNSLRNNNQFQNFFNNNLYNKPLYNNNTSNIQKPVMKVIPSNTTKKQWTRRNLFGKTFKNIF